MLDPFPCTCVSGVVAGEISRDQEVLPAPGEPQAVRLDSVLLRIAIPPPLVRTVIVLVLPLVVDVVAETCPCWWYCGCYSLTMQNERDSSVPDRLHETCSREIEALSEYWGEKYMCKTAEKRCR